MAKGAKISVNGLKMSAKYLMSDVVEIGGEGRTVEGLDERPVHVFLSCHDIHL